MAKHRKTGGIYGKTCRGKQRNTRGYMGNRKTGVKRPEGKIWQNLRKTGGYIRKHGNKWEYRYRGSIRKQGTTSINNILYIRDILWSLT